MVAATRTKPSPIFYLVLLGIFAAGAGILFVMASRAREMAAPRKIDPALLAATKAEGYLLGDPNAPVQMSEFGDFECPQCGLFASVTEPDIRTHLVDSGVVSFRYYDFPLPMHPNTVPASHAAACANAQGRFWQMHDRLYNGQLEWNAQATSSPRKVFKGYADELGLNLPQWEACFDQQTFGVNIEANRAEGDRRRVSGTPTFYIGDREFKGNLTYDALRKEVDAIVAAKKQAEPAPKGKTK